jgi:hypothetical protein
MNTTVSTVRDSGRVHATLRYLTDFQEILEGERRAGGRLHLDYAIERVTCRRERLGVPIRSLQSFIRFRPSDDAGGLRNAGTSVKVDAHGEND